VQKEYDSRTRRIFLFPSTYLLLVLTLFPICFSLAITFTNYRLLSENSLEFSLNNWVQLFSDKNFRIVLKNTAIFVLLGVIFQFTLGFGIAQLLNSKILFLKFFRITFLLPMMMSPVAVSYIVGKMLFSETFGPINDFLSFLGLPLFNWSLSPIKSMLLLIIIDTWQWTPFFILILLAGLQSIPEELFEAAKIDGASKFRIFCHITFPLLLPISSTVIFIRIIESFKVIDIVRIVTGGGPGNTTETVTLFAYDIGLKGGDISYASTIAYALLFLVIIFSIIYFAVEKQFKIISGNA
tara:strand:- start:7591 stop:8478 length:888 start_codon:yes stop_codon:yes gene_type:complete